MKPGKVISLRINPKNCLTVLDVCTAIGVTQTVGYSFGQLVSIALSSLLETVRQQNLVPTRSGFEYSEMMKPFENPSKRAFAHKMELSNKVTHPGYQPQPLVPSPVTQAQRVRFEELAFKKEQDPLNVTPAEEQEYIDLVNAIYG